MAVAAGYAHSVALKNDGTAIAWGDNSSGQTVIGGGLSAIKSIAAGGNHTLAVVFSSSSDVRAMLPPSDRIMP